MLVDGPLARRTDAGGWPGVRGGGGTDHRGCGGAWLVRGNFELGCVLCREAWCDGRGSWRVADRRGIA